MYVTGDGIGSEFNEEAEGGMEEELVRVSLGSKGAVLLSIGLMSARL